MRYSTIWKNWQSTSAILLFCQLTPSANFFLFISQIVFFGGPEVLWFIFSSAASQRTAYSEVTIPDDSPSKD
jgi:hypothetical protein